MDGILDIIEAHRAFFWPFIIIGVAATLWVAFKGGGWSALVAGPFIGILSGIFVSMGLKKIRGEI